MAELKEQVYRELGYHERFILVRHNLGHPPVICCVAQGKGDAAEREKLTSSIKEKIRLLLDTHALLSSHIHASRTDSPKYARWVRDVPVEDVLITSSSVNNSIAPPGQLLKENVARAKEEFADILKGPLWRVRMQHDETRDTFVVILTTHHFIMDGRGMGNVLEMLLSPSSSASFSKSISTSLQEVPPTAESSVKGYEIGYLHKKSIDLLAMLPTRLATYFASPSAKMWPKPSDIKRHPTQAEEHYTLTTFQGDNVLSNLKKQAKAHNIKTIHPLINTACLIALYRITGDGTHFDSDSPISERVALSNHTAYSGNYVSVQARKGVLQANRKVWDEARSFAQDAIVNRTKARQLFGELGYLMTQLKARSSSSYIPTDECPTACDDFFGRGLHSKQPYRASYGLSNLGAIQGLPPIIEKVYWAQPVQPMLDAITIGVCGFGPGKGKADEPKVDKAIGAQPTESVAVADKVESAAAAPPPQSREGLSISVGVRVGVLEDGKAEAFIDAFNRTLQLMATDLDDDITFAEVLSKLPPPSID